MVSNKSKIKIKNYLDMVLGKNVAIFDWEWGQNSAPSEGQKSLSVLIASREVNAHASLSFHAVMSEPCLLDYIKYGR